MPGDSNDKLIEQSEVNSPFWSTSSKALITEQYSKQSRQHLLSPPKTVPSRRPTTPQTPRTSFHERSTPTSGRYSSHGLGLIMAFNFQNSGGSSFFKTPPANNGSNSQVQAQSGSDLEDIQTEVSLLHCGMCYTSNRRSGYWLSGHFRRCKSTTPLKSMALGQSPSANVVALEHSFAQRSSSCCRAG